MRVARVGNGYYAIVRGQSTPQFFCFYVDDDSAAWSKRRDAAQYFERESLAEDGIVELRRRAKLKRERSGKAGKR